ncbi:MAG: prolyl aminopeptidase [Pseudomonadota bacterium]|nr:prolyl aminopeptidase [Pseudomonadota bacterium]
MSEQHLYPEIEPFESHMLQVSDVHSLYVEESGNPEGIPVLFIHGGPGGGTDPLYRRFFNPDKYRIILFDQRGCGKSTPFASLEDNTTDHLIDDIEQIRIHLGINRWHLFGGSWGSTLSLAYAQSFPKHVSAMVLRGIFLCREQDIKWFYQEGASHIFPDAFETYSHHIPVEERHDLVYAYYKRLTSDDENVRLEAAKHWTTWEMATSKLLPSKELIEKGVDPKFVLPFARIEAHYFVNDAFLTNNQLIHYIDKVRHIPCTIVHGRYDVVCPISQAYELHKAWPESKLIITPDAGHSAMENGTAKSLVEAADAFSHIEA